MSANGLANQRIVKECVCAQCFGRLVEKFIEGQYVVVCPKGCKPGGYVSQRYADESKVKARHEALEVQANYPELFGSPVPDKEQRRKMLRELYGEEP